MGTWAAHGLPCGACCRGRWRSFSWTWRALRRWRSSCEMAPFHSVSRLREVLKAISVAAI